MKYTHLGRTGLLVSRLCLGTMNFGERATEAESFAIMDQALELGINFFDTANIYGAKLGVGQAAGATERFDPEGSKIPGGEWRGRGAAGRTGKWKGNGSQAQKQPPPEQTGEGGCGAGGGPDQETTREDREGAGWEH